MRHLDKAKIPAAAYREIADAAKEVYVDALTVSRDHEAALVAVYLTAIITVANDPLLATVIGRANVREG